MATVHTRTHTDVLHTHLVDELVERVLSIGAWLSKVHLTRIKRQDSANGNQAKRMSVSCSLQNCA